MAVSVLFVCAGNVCRSPTAVAVARTVAKEAGVSELVLTFQSAGVSARSGNRWCERAQRCVRRRVDPENIAMPMTSRPVSEKLLADADLVLAADRATASTLLRRWPGMRERVFPLAVAAALAAELVAHSPQLTERADSANRGERNWIGGEAAIEPLVTRMNLARGRVSVGPDRGWPRRRSFRKFEIPAADLPDPHEAGTRVAHDPVVRQVAESTEDLVGSLLSVFRNPETVGD